jgi:hypothetical protein
MMANTFASVRDYVRSVDLQGVPRGLLSLDAATESTEVFDAAKKQAQVIGAGLVSFAAGVSPEAREAASESMLLAQLVASKRASLEADPLKWFSEYGDVLRNLGWLVADGGWTDYSASGTAVEVHQKIIEVLTVALGASPAALAILSAAVSALQSMNPSSSWITIFNRESQKARIARFQIGLVESDVQQVTLSILGCLIQARNSITQVLFFKFRDADAGFRANSSKLTIGSGALIDVGPMIRGRVRAYQADYVGSLKDI